MADITTEIRAEKVGTWNQNGTGNQNGTRGLVSVAPLKSTLPWMHAEASLDMSFTWLPLATRNLPNYPWLTCG